MKVCNYCKTKNPNDAKQCSACGASEFKIECENCGNIYNEGVFCPRCGVKAGTKAKQCPNCGKEYYSAACPDCGFTYNQRSQYPRYESLWYEQPYHVEQTKQDQPAPVATPAGRSKGGLILSIIGFGAAMLSLVLGIGGLTKLDGSRIELGGTIVLWTLSLVLAVSGLVCGIIGLAKKGNKRLALAAIIISAILLLVAIIFIAVISEEMNGYNYYW